MGSTAAGMNPRRSSSVDLGRMCVRAGRSEGLGGAAAGGAAGAAAGAGAAAPGPGRLRARPGPGGVCCCTASGPMHHDAQSMPSSGSHTLWSREAKTPAEGGCLYADALLHVMCSSPRMPRWRPSATAAGGGASSGWQPTRQRCAALSAACCLVPKQPSLIGIKQQACSRVLPERQTCACGCAHGGCMGLCA